MATDTGHPPSDQWTLNQWTCRAMGTPGCPYATDMAWAWFVVERMRTMGSSVILNWGEDTDQWEVSWITVGKRYTGIAAVAAEAVCRAFWLGMETATLSPEERK